MFNFDIEKGQISLVDGFKVEFVSETCADDELFFLVSGDNGKVYVCRIFSLEILESVDDSAVFTDISELKK